MLLAFLLLFELLQLISKIKEGEWYEYFGMQNICEFVMFSFTIGLFVAQWHDFGMQFGNNPTEWQNDDR